MRQRGSKAGRWLGAAVSPLLAALLAAVLCAPQALADDATLTQPAYLAAKLRHDPVYVTDQSPREAPRSTAGQYERLAAQAEVPVYVMVLPDYTAEADEVLPAVHDRLGRDGVYVLLEADGIGLDAEAFGVGADAEAAATAASYELPYDAGALAKFERFVDVLRSGHAVRRADAARRKYGGDHGQEPAKAQVTKTDRANQSFLTGTLLTGVPLLTVLVLRYVRRRRAAR